MNRKLRMGMVGGGRGAFIGAVHRMAANLDGKIELVAGCFSSKARTSKLSGKDFFLDQKNHCNVDAGLLRDGMCRNHGSIVLLHLASFCCSL